MMIHIAPPRQPRQNPRMTAATPRTSLPPSRHLLRARDLADRRYAEPLTVTDLAREAGWSPAHFSRAFRRAFGVTPHHYLLTRRLERAAALLRDTDRSVTEICFAVGLTSVGSFTTSFGRAYDMSPTAYRAASPPARRHLRIPLCVAKAWGRPQPGRPRDAPGSGTGQGRGTAVSEKRPARAAS